MGASLRRVSQSGNLTIFGTELAGAKHHNGHQIEPNGAALGEDTSKSVRDAQLDPESDDLDDETFATSVQSAFNSRKISRKPEIPAPAGGWPQLRAAVEGGADAVYFGLEALNARARASNFTVEEIADVIGYLHDRGVQGFVAINVLVFDEELAQAEKLVGAVVRAGVDAVIVQDVGLVSLIRRFAPDLVIHGSTQMSITSAEGRVRTRARM